MIPITLLPLPSLNDLGWFCVPISGVDNHSGVFLKSFTKNNLAGVAQLVEH